jgi:hypothetical protein
VLAHAAQRQAPPRACDAETVLTRGSAARLVWNAARWWVAKAARPRALRVMARRLDMRVSTSLQRKYVSVGFALGWTHLLLVWDVTFSSKMSLIDSKILYFFEGFCFREFGSWFLPLRSFFVLGTSRCTRCDTKIVKKTLRGAYKPRLRSTEFGSQNLGDHNSESPYKTLTRRKEVHPTKDRKVMACSECEVSGGAS